MKDKLFMTYDEQVKKLNDKLLVIDDRDKLISLLKKHSYFTLINGYKKPFKNKDNNYKKNTRIDDIYALYRFDDCIRQIFLKSILKVELHIKSLISYSFCDNYGEDQSEYCNPNNYRHTDPALLVPISKLINLFVYRIRHSEKFAYIHHQMTEHGNIPLWAMIKTLAFGNVSKMYSFLKSDIQSEVSKEFPIIRENELETILDVLTRYRNVCAHNERLFDFKYHDARLKTTSIHKYFNLYTINPVASNLFDVVIFLKYLLPTDDFNAFIEEINNALNMLSVQTNQIQHSQLLKLMSFPQNWFEIKNLTVE